MILRAGGGELALDTIGLRVGETAEASDKLKLLVLDKTFSKRFTDLTISLSLPYVETTLMFESGAGDPVGVVAVGSDRRSNVRSVRSTLLVMFLIIVNG